MDEVKVKYTCFQEVSLKVIKGVGVRKVTCQLDVYLSLLIDNYSVWLGSIGMRALWCTSSHMTS